MIPVKEWSTPKDRDEGATYFKVYSRRVAEVKFGKIPNLPKKFDPSWGMSFPDWENIPRETREAFYEVTDKIVEASGFYAFERGPGRLFGSEPYVKVGKRYVVVKQSVGLDI